MLLMYVSSTACQCRRHKRHRFNPWVGKIPWRRAWQPTPVFLPGEFHGQRSLAGYSSWNHKESEMTERLSTAHCGKWCFLKIVCNFKARSRSVLVVSFLCSSTGLLNRMHFSRAEWYYWELLGLLCVILSLAAAEECFNILEK